MSDREMPQQFDWSLAEIEVRAALLMDVFRRLESILLIHCKGSLLIYSERADTAYIHFRRVTEDILKSKGFEELLRTYPANIIPRSLHSMSEDADIDFELTIQGELNKFIGELLEFCLEVKADYGDFRDMFTENVLNPWDALIDSFRNYKRGEEKEFFEKLDKLDKFYQRKETNETSSHIYVNSDRIDELRSTSSIIFDLSKLIKLCEELNQVYSMECWLATAMLVRAVLDHVPPIFNCKSFSEVVNNYNGSKSFKQSMAHLENSSRKIADAILHTQIRKGESLPNKHSSKRK